MSKRALHLSHALNKAGWGSDKNRLCECGANTRHELAMFCYNCGKPLPTFHIDDLESIIQGLPDKDPDRTVKIVYFKPSGKYYTEGEYQTQIENVENTYDIFSEVKAMFKANIAPGMINVDKDFTAIVFPNTVNGFPALILCEQ